MCFLKVSEIVFTRFFAFFYFGEFGSILNKIDIGSILNKIDE